MEHEGPSDEDLGEMLRAREILDSLGLATNCQVCGALTDSPSGWCKRCSDEQSLIDSPPMSRPRPGSSR